MRETSNDEKPQRLRNLLLCDLFTETYKYLANAIKTRLGLCPSLAARAQADKFVKYLKLVSTERDGFRKALGDGCVVVKLVGTGETLDEAADSEFGLVELVAHACSFIRSIRTDGSKLVLIS